MSSKLCYLLLLLITNRKCLWSRRKCLYKATITASNLNKSNRKLHESMVNVMSDLSYVPYKQYQVQLGYRHKTQDEQFKSNRRLHLPHCWLPCTKSFDSHRYLSYQISLIPRWLLLSELVFSSSYQCRFL